MNSDDLLKKQIDGLRQTGANLKKHGSISTAQDLIEAADTIEALQAERDKLKAEREAWMEACEHGWEKKLKAAEATIARLREALGPIVMDGWRQFWKR